MLSTRIFRLFLSSTFSDFVAEREALRTRVFPQLEKLCRDHGAVFQAVDLRWGITEEAQREQDTMRICLQEIRRCQQLSPRPNFAVLLGNRYGWEPPPARIPIDHWRRLLAAASSAERKIIRAGYRGPDRNAMPPVYHIHDRQDGWELSESRERILRDALRSCVAKADFPEAEKVAYFASATHQEIILGALLDHDEQGAVLHPERHVHVYVRSLDGMPRDQSASDFLDWDASRGEPVAEAAARLHALEQQLRNRLGGHVHDLHTHWDRHGRGGAVDEAYLDAFCERFLADQTALIQAELGALARPDAAVERQRAHEEFGAARCKVFAGRKKLLKTIAASTGTRGTRASQRPLVVVGGGGSGKSALLARAAQERRRECEGTASVIMERYIGGVPGTESLMVTLTDLIADLAKAYEQPEPPRPESTQQMTEAFEQALQYATAERPLYLYLDALDQLSSADGAWVLDWLPQQLPPYAKVVVTVRSGTSVESAARGRFGRRVLQVPPMSASEGRAMLAGLLADKRSAWFNAGIAPTTGRALTRDQKKVVLDGFAQSLGSPLWLKLAYEEASTWASWESPTLPTTVPRLIENFIDRRLLERDNHPRVFTERALAYITAGRFGLAEHELARALGGDAEVRAEFRSAERTQRKWQDPKLLPPILWSRLFFDLQAYLAMAATDGALVMRWFHREFGEALKARYLAAPSDLTRIHGALADLFEAEEREQRPDSTDDTDLFRATDASGTPSSAALRRVMEQPWQLAAGGRNDELRVLLTDFGFCMGKCAANRAADLVADMTAMARGGESWRSAEAWRRFFLRCGHMLRRGDVKWPSHKILLQLGIEEADDAPITQAAEAWLERGACDWAWMKSRKRPVRTVHEALVVVMEGHAGPICGVEVFADGRVLSWSEDGTLRLWNVQTGAPLALMEGHNNRVAAAKLLSDSRIVSWAWDRKLRYWDGETGAPLAVLSGRTASLEIDKEFPRTLPVKALPNGRELLRLKDGTLELWDVEARVLLVAMEGHAEEVNGVEFLHDGRVLSWSNDGTLRLWQGETGRELAVMQGHRGRVNGALVLPEGNVLSWSNDCTLRLWHGTTGAALALMEGHRASVLGARVLPDGHRVVSWSHDGTLRLWTAQTGSPLAVMVGHTDDTVDAEVLTDGRVLSWAGDGTLRLWDSRDGAPLAVMIGHASSVQGAKVLADDRILSWSRDGTLRLWDSYAASLALTNSYRGPVENAKLLPDGRVLSWSRDGAMCFWNGQTGEALVLMEGHTNPVDNPLVLADDRVLSWAHWSWLLTSPSGDCSLRLWDGRTGASLAVMEGHTSGIEGAVVLADNRVLSWSWDCTLRLWDGQTGSLLAVMEEHAGPVSGATVLADGRILSWACDGIGPDPNHSAYTLRVWDGQTGAALAVMARCFEIPELEDAALLPDASILGRSRDGTLHLWNGRTGVQLVLDPTARDEGEALLDTQRRFLSSAVSCAPDSRAGTGDSDVYLLRSPGGDYIAYVNRRARLDARWHGQDLGLIGYTSTSAIVNAFIELKFLQLMHGEKPLPFGWRANPEFETIGR